MNFLTGFRSDKGIVKETNQDSLCTRIAKTDIGNIAMGVVCDGMGGYAKGEIASSAVVNAFCKWFDEDLQKIIQHPVSPDVIRESWNMIIQQLNHKIFTYGIKNNIQIGTTLTALLIVDDKFMVFVNIGDSRIYKIKETCNTITEDQTVVQFELRNGKISEEQALEDPRNHILLQCMGGTEIVQPVFGCDYVENDCMYMLCSDGFYKKITVDEIQKYLNPMNNLDEAVMERRAYDIVEIAKSRMEEDNISVILLRTL